MSLQHIVIFQSVEIHPQSLAYALINFTLHLRRTVNPLAISTDQWSNYLIHSYIVNNPHHIGVYQIILHYNMESFAI